MRGRVWRVALVPVLAAGMYGILDAGSTALASAPITITQGVSLSVPAEEVARICTTGQISACAPIAVGPVLVSGSLTVTVVVPDVTPGISQSACTSGNGIAIQVSGAASGGSLYATFDGIVNGKAVHQEVSVPTPSKTGQLSVSLCVS